MTYKNDFLYFFKKWRVFFHNLTINYYEKFKTTPFAFTFWFLIHRYHSKQFYPLYAKENLKTLFQLEQGEFLDCTRKGHLYVLNSPSEKFWFSFKNALLFGAYQSRVERAVLYTFISLTLELNNPFHTQILKIYLYRKINLLKRALERVSKINNRQWKSESIQDHIHIFLVNSLLQHRVITQIERAVLKSKEPEIVKEAKRAMKKGLYPILAITGYSGSYWMRGTNREILGIFKPFDEEIHAPNNPLGGSLQSALGQRRTRFGCRVGEAAHHEVGAFLVDSFFGFGIVPKTYYAQFTHSTFYSAHEKRLKRVKDKTKYGSFQEFVSGFISFIDLPEEEYKTIPLDEFQLLVLLDVIIGNCDRNAGNFLVGDEKIAAIDHGLCFPDVPEAFKFWYWSVLPQGEQPLYPSMVDLINHFPLEELGWKLKKNCFISLSSIERMRERITLFAEGVNQNLTPSQISEFFTLENLMRISGLNSTLKEETAKIVKEYKASLETFKK